MTSLLYFIVAIMLSLIFARYNESKKLFWILIISFMIGAIGGAMYSDYKSNTKSKAKSAQKASIQTSVNTAKYPSLDAILTDTQTFKAKSVGQTYFVRDSRYVSYAPSKCLEDIRAQPFKAFDTS